MNNDKISVTEQEGEAFNAMAVEWKSGDKCDFENRSGSGIFISIFPDEDKYYNQTMAVIAQSRGVFLKHLSDLQKPETLEQKEEREREKVVYSMCAEVDNFTDDAMFWAGRFYDLNYRKATNND